jgi:isocitrate lyase
MPANLVQQLSREQQIAALEKDWATNPRWKGVKRGYSAADVVRLRGSMPIEHTLAKRGAEKLYALMEKAHKARKKSERGKDTKLRKGLA